MGNSPFLDVFETASHAYILNAAVIFQNTRASDSVTWNGTDTATIVAAGSYQVIVSVTASSGAAPAVAAIRLRKNGIPVSGTSQVSAVEANSDVVSNSVSVILPALVPGDTIDVQNSGGPITFNLANMTIVRVGA